MGGWEERGQVKPGDLTDGRRKTILNEWAMQGSQVRLRGGQDHDAEASPCVTLDTEDTPHNHTGMETSVTAGLNL